MDASFEISEPLLERIQLSAISRVAMFDEVDEDHDVIPLITRGRKFRVKPHSGHRSDLL